MVVLDLHHLLKSFVDDLGVGKDGVERSHLLVGVVLLGGI